MIGFNNIPKLLSIKPYDINIIENRGFLNQYRIEDECNTDNKQVKIKLNSQKHFSVKNSLRLNNLNNKKLNYSSLVKNPIRNRNLKENCNNVLNKTEEINNYYTPFKLFKNR